MTERPSDEGIRRREGEGAADDLLIDELRSVVAELDPVPDRVLAAARGSFTWRTIDVELAALAYDSVLDEDRLALVRSGDAARLLTFETPELSVELEVTVVGKQRRIVGQLVPPSAGVVELRHAGGLLTLDADELGRFAAEGVEPGPVSLRCRAAGAAAIATEWTTV